MEFQGIKRCPITLLGLSQIYLSRDKIKGVEGWLTPQRAEQLEPLPVHAFGNGVYTLTDGHTRAYVAYKNGCRSLPVVYDNDEIVAGKLGKSLYLADIEWCERFHLRDIRDLESRILSSEDYQRLWIRRCDRSYALLTRASQDQRAEWQGLLPDLFLYGASEDLSELFYERENGDLYRYKNRSLQREAGDKRRKGAQP